MSSQPGEAPRVVRFPLADLGEQLEAFAMRWPRAVADARGWVFHVAADPSRQGGIRPAHSRDRCDHRR